MKAIRKKDSSGSFLQIYCESCTIKICATKNNFTFYCITNCFAFSMHKL
jgi:hypothetical protein